MKENKNPNQVDRMWIFTSNPHLKEILPYFLSPLELAVLSANFKLRDYKIGQRTLTLDRKINLALRDEAKQRVKFFYNLLRRERIRDAKWGTDIAVRRFLISSPERHALPRSVQNKLSHNGIKKMEQVAAIGRDQLPYYDRMGKRSTAQLVALFEMYGCGDLI